MTTMLFRAAMLALLGALAGCASDGGPREREAEKLALYEQFAGEPVKDFAFWRLDRWDVLGDYDLAVWTTLNDAYLIRVSKPCSGMSFANTVAVTSTQNRVHARFDAVLFEQQRCRISEIRPVDGKAYKAARRDAG